MKALIVGAVLILSYVIAFEAGKESPLLGEFLGMRSGHGLLVILLGIIVFCFYQAVDAVIARLWKSGTGHEEENSGMPCCYSEDINDDLYLVGLKILDKGFAYQVVNKEKELLWRSRCCLEGENVDLIELYDGASAEGVTLRYDCREGCYVIEEGSALLGKMGFRDKELVFNVGEKDVYTAVFVPCEEGLGIAADWLLSLDSFREISTSEQNQYFILRDENGSMLGKFYQFMKNIDLSIAQAHYFDRRILILMSILLDNRMKRFV